MDNPAKCEWNEINRLKSPNRLKRTTFSSTPVFLVIFRLGRLVIFRLGRLVIFRLGQKYVFHLFSIRNYRDLYVNGKQPLYKFMIT